jgi:hypothetical protein
MANPLQQQGKVRPPNCRSSAATICTLGNCSADCTVRRRFFSPNPRPNLTFSRVATAAIPGYWRGTLPLRHSATRMTAI